jgi:HSP20 family protein
MEAAPPVGRVQEARERRDRVVALHQFDPPESAVAEETEMAITRYSYRSPWQELDNLTSRLSQVFGSEMPMPANGGTWLPAVNVEETGDGLVLTAEVPGMTAEDIEIELENNILTIRGEKSFERTEGEDEKRYHVWERRQGSFQRSFTLPRTVRAEDIKAEYENGILTIRLPKAPEAKSRKIQIGAGTQRTAEVGKKTK